MLNGIRDEDPIQNGYQYGIVSADGLSITRLPMPPRMHGAPRPWFETDYNRGPVPSPVDARYISFGRLHLYDRLRGTWQSARISADSGPDHLHPWAAAEQGWMVFALPHGGHGGSTGAVLLPPRLTVEPFDEPGLVVVVGTGDGLNIRDSARFAGTVLETVPDGTTLKVASPDSSPRAGSERNADADWLYVESPAGSKGWVNAAYLSLS